MEASGSIRNKQIYKEWISGVSQIKLGVKYDMTPQRICQICKEERERGEKESLLDYLCKMYPNRSRKVISGAINSIWQYNFPFPYTKNRPEITTDRFFEVLMTMTDEDILFARGIGKGKFEILKGALEIWKKEKEVKKA